MADRRLRLLFEEVAERGNVQWAKGDGSAWAIQTAELQADLELRRFEG